MKISIYNFKSITAVVNYELKPLNILSGTNSSGKSSFIQLLLLLKETIDLDSSKYPLYLKNELFKVKNFKDLVHKKDFTKDLRISFMMDKNDFQKFSNSTKGSVYDGLPDYTCLVEIVFGQYKSEPYVKEFLLKYILTDIDKKEQFIRFRTKKDDTSTYEVESNVTVFGKNVWNPKLDILNISYSSIFPLSYETYDKETKPSPKSGQDIEEEIRDVEYTNVESVKSYLTAFFKNLHYLGPLREAPKDDYVNNDSAETVGPRGEFVAQVMETYKDNKVTIYIPNYQDGEMTFEPHQKTLLEGVRYWLCDVFEVATDLITKNKGEVLSIILVTAGGVEVSLRHVGFGISQILPILVEGLLMPREGTLVLEQPEIHLHPKIQSKLFDFLYSLTLAGKSVIVETHSDHLINRLRRRVAEDSGDTIKDIVNLTFIETGGDNLLFRNIALDDFGTLDYFPEDFIEKRDRELKAMVQAQMRKKIKKGSR